MTNTTSQRGIALCVALLICLALPLSSAMGSDLGLNAASGRIGTLPGMTYMERNGTLAFGYGKIYIDPAGATVPVLLNGEGRSLGGGQLTRDFAEAAVLKQGFSDGGELRTTLTPEADGSMTLRQSATVPSGGISGASFTLTVPIDYDIIIPAWNGIRLTKDNPAPYFAKLVYPNVWSAQMLLIQTETGGLLIHADDNGSQFKSLNITSDDNYFYLTLECIPQAPFTDYTAFDAVPWRMIPYAGDWLQGALRYKAYASETFGLNEIQSAKPEWSQDIQLVCLMDMVDRQLIDELAKLCDPTKTMLQLVNWRQSNYDTDYPNYAVRSGLKEGIAYAHTLGFKVSVHANMIGAHLDNADYLNNNLEDATALDSRTLEPVIERYSAYGTDYAFAQINQASTVWQDVLIAQLTRVVEETGVDIIHLDQSLLCFNDGRGLVNGMTSMQGNVELQRRLAEALPNVVLSGEGINEFNMRYTSLLQQHVYGLDNASKTWSEGWFDQICPITSVLFGDYVTFYHYPALPTTNEASESYYQAWYRAGNQRANEIPCLYRMSLDELKAPTETMAMVLEEARFRQENMPVIDLNPWGEDVLLSLKLQDGTIAQWKKDDYGSYFLPDASKPDEVTARFVSGVEKAPVQGSIKGWRMYDEEQLLGLRSDESYLVSSEPRDLLASHISKVDKNLTTRVFEETDAYAIVGLAEIESSNERVISLLKYGGEMRAGELLVDGTVNSTVTFNSLNNFGFKLPSQAEIRHYNDRIFMHPSWINERDVIGCAWLEADVTLDVYGKTVFTASPQMASAVNAALGDGVDYKFYFWEKDDPTRANMVSYEVYVPSEIGTPITLDLTAFEGKTITLRIECYPHDYPANDSSVLVAPCIVQTRGNEEKMVTYEVTLSKPPITALSLSGKAQLNQLSDTVYEVTSGISDTVFFIYENAPIKGYADLTVLPRVDLWKMDDGQTKAVQGGREPSQAVLEIGKELRNGILSIPPDNGTISMNYLVALPTKAMQFYGALALKDNAKNSNGVTYILRVNGEVLFEKEIQQGSNFEEVMVDLSAYADSTVLLSLEVNANGDSVDDYAFWGDPSLEYR